MMKMACKSILLLDYLLMCPARQPVVRTVPLILWKVCINHMSLLRQAEMIGLILRSSTTPTLLKVLTVFVFGHLLHENERNSSLDRKIELLHSGAP